MNTRAKVLRINRQALLQHRDRTVELFALVEQHAEVEESANVLSVGHGDCALVHLLSRRDVVKAFVCATEHDHGVDAVWILL